MVTKMKSVDLICRLIISRLRGLKMVQTFVFTTRYFLILVVALIILINSPVIFSSATARPALIDVTAVLGSIATVAIFFMNTLLTYSGRR